MAVAEWWEAAKAAVAAYTGMTPAVFFTVAAVSAALYVAVSGLRARPAQVPEEEERVFEPLPPPVQLGEVTEEELRAYDGSDPKKPLLMAIKGQIYDVTQSRMFYGPGGPYASFAGRDASRALAKMSFEPNDLTGDISGLGPFEVEALQEWEYKFKSKYVTVGKIKKNIPVSEGDTERAVTADREIDASNMPTCEPESTNQGSIVEKTRETLDVDVNAISNENVEKTKELPDLDVPNTSSHADAAEKQEETPNVAERSNSKTEDSVDPKGTAQAVDEKNMCKPEDATEKPKEAPDAVDGNNTASNEDAGQRNENDLNCRQGEERLKEALDVEAKNA